PGANVAGGEDAGHARLEQVAGVSGRAGEDEPVLVACDDVVEPFGARQRAEEEEEERERKALAALESDRLQLAVLSAQLTDLAPVADHDVVTVELVHKVVGHRLAQVGAAVQQRDERAAAREPDGGLAGRIPSADDADAGRSAALRLGRPGCVAHAHTVVIPEADGGETAVLHAGPEPDA